MSVMTTTEKAGYDALVSGAAQALKKDGSVALTADQPMGTHALTGLRAGAASGESVRYEQLLTTLAAVDAVNVVVQATTVTALPAYTVSGAGVGETLTATANGALTAQDGITLATGDLLLVRHAVSSVNNDVFTLTQGTGGTPYVLTRYTGLNTAAALLGSRVRVRGGQQKGGAEYTYVATDAITFGTTRLFRRRTDAGRSASDGIYWFDDLFYWGVPNVANSIIGNSGAILNVPTGGGAGTQTDNGTNNAYGTIFHQTGTTATGVCGLEWGGATAIAGGFAYAQDTGFDEEVRCQAPVLSTAAQEFVLTVGLYKTTADGLYFKYDRTISLNWLAVAIVGGVSTVVDSGVVVTATNWNVLQVVHDSGSNNVRFYIDRALITTCTTNLPTGVIIGLQSQATKTVGTTTTTALKNDWARNYVDFPLGRG